MANRQSYPAEPDAVQSALVWAARTYLQHRRDGLEYPLVSDGETITCTEAVVAAKALLDAAGLEPFELSMWSALGRL